MYRMLVLLSFWMLYVIVVASESFHNQCPKDYRQPTDTKCNKTWTNFTDVILQWSLRNTIDVQNFDILHTVLQYVSTLLNSCSTGSRENNDKRVQTSLILPYVHKPCGKMQESLYAITELKTWVIEVPSDFAVNITFLQFFLDEPVSIDKMNLSRCMHNFVTIQYYNKIGVLCDIEDPKHCSWKAPWSIIIPSNQVVLSLTSVMVIRHYKLHYIYQTIEKCNNYYNLLRAHYIRHVGYIFENINIVVINTDMLYNWLIRGTPGYHLNLKFLANFIPDDFIIKICDGPRPPYCKSLQNGTISEFFTIMFHSFVSFYGTFYKNTQVLILFDGIMVTPRKLSHNQTHLVNVTNKDISLFHEAWEISANFAVKIGFRITEFTGPTDEYCIYGGYSILPSRVEYQYVKQPHKDMLQRFYGPFCFSAPSVPLLDGGLSHLTLPNGTHTLVFYSFMDMFTIDLEVEITHMQSCTGHINICRVCFNALEHNHTVVIAHDHLSKININCINVDRPHPRIMNVLLQFPSKHQCVTMQHIAGEKFPCFLSIISFRFHLFFVPYVMLRVIYISETKKEYENTTNNCTTKVKASDIHNYQGERLNLSHAISGRSVYVSKAWYIRMYNTCDTTYRSLLTYTTSMHANNSNTCSLHIVNRTRYIREPKVSCGQLYFGQPVVFTYMLIRTAHRFNIDISRQGICTSHDKVRVIYGLKQEHVVGICNEKYYLDYASLLYNTLIINSNVSALRFQVPCGNLGIQVFKLSLPHCSLRISYDLILMGRRYFGKHIQCLPIKGWINRQNQVNIQAK